MTIKVDNATAKADVDGRYLPLKLCDCCNCVIILKLLRTSNKLIVNKKIYKLIRKLIIFVRCLNRSTSTAVGVPTFYSNYTIKVFYA